MFVLLFSLLLLSFTIASIPEVTDPEQTGYEKQNHQNKAKQNTKIRLCCSSASLKSRAFNLVGYLGCLKSS